MGVMTFQRARTEDQRDERRQSILATASQMLREMPVAQISLNELSRRVGLAKSNVLRYFESREAILLELLNQEMAEWAAALESSLPPANGTSVRQRGDELATQLARALASNPVMCDLISAQASVLERNVSVDVALHHKRATARTVSRLMEAISRSLPEVKPPEAYHIVATTLLMSSAAWPHSQPSEALLAAYEADPAIAQTQTSFQDSVQQTIEVTISGVLARRGIGAI